ncbi:hypothetical protein KSP35_09625 [Aquihabitans sp. G128]|uniref:hypothetical protein n=1 Tax=Aquihabitans sp. G128 TaxID=2849779 RepID=UPI001C238694|nr:hypothetical protein [Aquihabitans sp. G128]QXC63012.1 hypothetical protein KSP35_09625 [Aquihabitans sp. G128]
MQRNGVIGSAVVRMAAAVGLAGLALAGCGSGSDGAASPPTSAKAPAWACEHRDTFTPVGQPIYADPADAPDTSKPESVAGSPPSGTHRVELSRSATKVVFGFVDGDGKLQQRADVDGRDGVWAQGASTECPGDGEQFETVGSSISSGD